MLSSEYCLRLSSNAYNPARSCSFSSQFIKFFDKNPNHIRSGDLSDIGFSQKNNLVTSVYSTPPWHLLTPTVDVSLSTLSKSVTSSEIFLSKFLEICEGLQDYHHIYTDGSKMNNLTAAAALGRASAAKPASSQQNLLLLTSLLILSDVPNVKKFPSSRIRSQVFWPLITVILKQVMCRNLSQITEITASYQTLERSLF